MNALETINIRPGIDADLPVMLNLLAAAKLPTGDLGDCLPGTFLIAESTWGIVGIAGLERLGDDGLMRSLAIADTWRGLGLGDRLVKECETMAHRAALKQVYLLTTTAADYFLKRGYADIARDSVPATVAGHAQFRSLCPASARCLRKELDG